MYHRWYQFISDWCQKGGSWYPQEEDYTYQYDELCVASMWWRVTFSRGLGCPARSHPRCKTAGTSQVDGPDKTVSAHNGKGVHIDGMSCRLAVLVIGEGALWCSLSLSQKAPSQCIHQSLPGCIWTGILPPSFGWWCHCPWGNQKGADGVLTSKVNLYP